MGIKVVNILARASHGAGFELPNRYKLPVYS
jgi:hypothetical protein